MRPGVAVFDLIKKPVQLGNLFNSSVYWDQIFRIKLRLLFQRLCIQLQNTVQTGIRVERLIILAIRNLIDFVVFDDSVNIIVKISWIDNRNGSVIRKQKLDHGIGIGVLEQKQILI